MRTDPEIERRQTMRNTEKHRKVTFVLPLPLLRIRTPEESTCSINRHYERDKSALYAPLLTSPTSTAHTAIREREGTPNFDKIVLTCVSTVRWLTTSV